MSNYQNLKCSELKDLLAKKGLPSHGKKNELLERLLKHEQETGTGSNSQGIGDNADSKDGGKNKKKISVNTKEEYSKGGLSKMTSYFKNILGSSNTSTDNSKYYENNNSKNNANENKSGTDEEHKKVVITQITFSESNLSPQNTLQKNIISRTEDNLYLTEEKKREMRRKRFGTDCVSTPSALESRAKRFCIVTKQMEEENKRKRAERFGLNVGNLNNIEMKKKRAERFGAINDHEKLKARALRFGITQ
ncbi:SAP domain-containing protein, putative [Plasmodium vinckei brucechwatti]|uniref:SAP domain-containing protein, putative n=1 Tax=Plasmodium vinckei brucechwatti TaxID=119398 RepID=A0A6V7S7L6_PLAVN|nr:SAP domain-containing protein, putative [Plasmodium vinckei brucechwatti]